MQLREMRQELHDQVTKVSAYESSSSAANDKVRLLHDTRQRASAAEIEVFEELQLQLQEQKALLLSSENDSCHDSKAEIERLHAQLQVERNKCCHESDTLISSQTDREIQRESLSAELRDADAEIKELQSKLLVDQTSLSSFGKWEPDSQEWAKVAGSSQVDDDEDDDERYPSKKVATSESFEIQYLHAELGEEYLHAEGERNACLWSEEVAEKAQQAEIKIRSRLKEEVSELQQVKSEAAFLQQQVQAELAASSAKTEKLLAAEEYLMQGNACNEQLRQQLQYERSSHVSYARLARVESEEAVQAAKQNSLELEDVQAKANIEIEQLGKEFEDARLSHKRYAHNAEASWVHLEKLWQEEVDQERIKVEQERAAHHACQIALDCGQAHQKATSEELQVLRVQAEAQVKQEDVTEQQLRKATTEVQQLQSWLKEQRTEHKELAKEVSLLSAMRDDFCESQMWQLHFELKEEKAAATLGEHASAVALTTLEEVARLQHELHEETTAVQIFKGALQIAQTGQTVVTTELNDMKTAAASETKMENEFMLEFIAASDEAHRLRVELEMARITQDDTIENAKVKAASENQFLLEFQTRQAAANMEIETLEEQLQEERSFHKRHAENTEVSRSHSDKFWRNEVEQEKTKVEQERASRRVCQKALDRAQAQQSAAAAELQVLRVQASSQVKQMGITEQQLQNAASEVHHLQFQLRTQQLKYEDEAKEAARVSEMHAETIACQISSSHHELKEQKATCEQTSTVAFSALEEVSRLQQELHEEIAAVQIFEGALQTAQTGQAVMTTELEDVKVSCAAEVKKHNEIILELIAATTEAQRLRVELETTRATQGEIIKNAQSKVAAEMTWMKEQQALELSEEQNTWHSEILNAQTTAAMELKDATTHQEKFMAAFAHQEQIWRAELESARAAQCLIQHLEAEVLEEMKNEVALEQRNATFEQEQLFEATHNHKEEMWRSELKRILDSQAEEIEGVKLKATNEVTSITLQMGQLVSAAHGREELWHNEFESARAVELSACQTEARTIEASEVLQAEFAWKIREVALQEELNQKIRDSTLQKQQEELVAASAREAADREQRWHIELEALSQQQEMEATEKTKAQAAKEIMEVRLQEERLESSLQELRAELHNSKVGAMAEAKSLQTERLAAVFEFIEVKDELMSAAADKERGQRSQSEVIQEIKTEAASQIREANRHEEELAWAIAEQDKTWRTELSTACLEMEALEMEQGKVVSCREELDSSKAEARSMDRARESAVAELLIEREKLVSAFADQEKLASEMISLSDQKQEKHAELATAVADLNERLAEREKLLLAATDQSQRLRTEINSTRAVEASLQKETAEAKETVAQEIQGAALKEEKAIADSNNRWCAELAGAREAANSQAVEVVKLEVEAVEIVKLTAASELKDATKQEEKVASFSYAEKEWWRHEVKAMCHARAEALEELGEVTLQEKACLAACEEKCRTECQSLAARFSSNKSETGETESAEVQAEQSRAIAQLAVSLAESLEAIFLCWGRPEKQEKISEIKPYLYVGNQESGWNKDNVLEAFGITHILNCTDFATAVDANFYRTNCKLHNFQKYLAINARDTSSFNIVRCISDAHEFIAAARESGGKVLVHCVAGMNRSVALVMGHLMLESRQTHDFPEVLRMQPPFVSVPSAREALRLAWFRIARHRVALTNESFQAQLVIWAASNFDVQKSEAHPLRAPMLFRVFAREVLDAELRKRSSSAPTCALLNALVRKVLLLESQFDLRQRYVISEAKKAVLKDFLMSKWAQAVLTIHHTDSSAKQSGVLTLRSMADLRSETPQLESLLSTRLARISE